MTLIAVTELVSSPSLNENQRDQPYWIGLNDRSQEGSFRWMDETEEVRILFITQLSLTSAHLKTFMFPRVSKNVVHFCRNIEGFPMSLVIILS